MASFIATYPMEAKRLQVLTDFCPSGKTLRNLANRIDAKVHASIVENTAGLFKGTEHGRKEANFGG